MAATATPRRKKPPPKRKAKRRGKTTVRSAKTWKAPTKLGHRMPAPTKKVVGQVEAAIESLPAAQRRKAKALLRATSPKDLCMCLHGMRRWYSGQTSLKHVAKLREQLARSGAMELGLPKGSYRGFKVDKDSPLAEMKPGKRVKLSVTRNHGVSSWTTSRAVANRFSGASKGKVGIVVKLVGGPNVKTIIAPPSRSASWFNNLYARTMGASFRDKETEFTVKAPKVDVEIVAVKR